MTADNKTDNIFEDAEEKALQELKRKHAILINLVKTLVNYVTPKSLAELNRLLLVLGDNYNEEVSRLIDRLRFGDSEIVYVMELPIRAKFDFSKWKLHLALSRELGSPYTPEVFFCLSGPDSKMLFSTTARPTISEVGLHKATLQKKVDSGEWPKEILPANLIRPGRNSNSVSKPFILFAGTRPRSVDDIDVIYNNKTKAGGNNDGLVAEFWFQSSLITEQVIDLVGPDKLEEIMVRIRKQILEELSS